MCVIDFEQPRYEALGQLCQDEPASGRRWSYCVALLLYIGQMSLGDTYSNLTRPRYEDRLGTRSPKLLSLHK